MLAEIVVLSIFPALMAFAACSDLLTMTISNRVAIALIVAFFALAIATGMNAAEMAAHSGVALATLVVAFICFARGWIGGGDAKLAAATVLWLGFDHVLTYLIWASLFGGILTLLVIRFRLTPLPSWLADQDWARRLHRMDAGVPYGIALAASALLVYPETGFMQALV